MLAVRYFSTKKLKKSKMHMSRRDLDIRGSTLLRIVCFPVSLFQLSPSAFSFGQGVSQVTFATRGPQIQRESTCIKKMEESLDWKIAQKSEII